MLGLLSGGPDTSTRRPELELSAFCEPERACADLERIATRTSTAFLDALLPLLAESPNPDQSLNLLERLVDRGDEQVFRLLSRHPTLLHYVILIFGRSYWLGETLLHNTDLLEKLLRDKRLELSLTREDYKDSLARFRAQDSKSGFTAMLVRFKKREYVRILLRDALGAATLADTTQEISALADTIIQEALDEAQRQMHARNGGRNHRGLRVPFAMLALGKLGGNELNYSSDVDLLYLYGEGVRDEERSLREHFVRQAQLVTELLSQATPEGVPFRIDLRLRPQGSEGELAVALEQALDYYSRVARDWELQALIKARYCAGDESLARAFIHGVQRHIYKETENFAAIETALYSRERMGARRRQLAATSKTPATLDVKLDRGGIRDIEFLAQCLQRVYGGDELWLRASGTLFSLQKLHDKAHLSGNDFQELTQAYQLLRRVEHALQVQRGRQVHHLPRAAAELKTLQRAVNPSGVPGTPVVGVTGRGGAEQPDAFLSEVRLRMARVAEIYERVIHSEQHSQQQREKGIALEALRPAAATVREMSFAQVMDRLAVDAPELHDVVAQADLSLHARRNLHRFLTSALTSSERYAALVEHPLAVGRALELFETSDYLTDIMVRHPDVVTALETSTVVSDRAQVAGLPSGGKTGDAALALAQLRRDFRKSAFTVGAQDVLTPRGAFASMREITRLGDAAIRHALKIVNAENLLAVFALGRLGTEEFDIASDADLLFVRTPEAAEEEARLGAERLVHALSAYTKDGSIFAVDARLRPRGAAGELVVTPSQIERYLTEEAQAWEALSYSKLRFVAGREDLATLVLTQVRRQIVAIGARPEFPQAVSEMRERLEKANRYRHSFKLARGGFYDIDFVASYLMLREASLAQGNTLDRLHHLLEQALLDPPAFAALREAALLYRTADHVIRLITGRARPELPEAEHARQCVERLANRIHGYPEDEDVQSRLAGTAEVVRSIFLAVIERY